MSEHTLPHDHGAHLQGADHMPDESQFQVVAEIFKQLCDPSRIRIFWILCHYEVCVANLAALMEMSSPAVSHHLRLLRSSGLIISRREGKEVFYQAAKTRQAQHLHQMIEQMVEISCPTRN